MSCKDYVLFMSGHIDGTNSQKDEKTLQSHLVTCPQCRQTLEEMKANDCILQSNTLVPPERILKNVMASVRNDAKKKTNSIRHYIVSFAAAAAVLCLVLVATLRTPEKPNTDGQITEVPNQSVADYAGDEVSAITGYEAEGAAAYATESDSSTTKGYSTRSATPKAGEAYHCIFVELPSSASVPADLATVPVEDFYFQIPREAQDHYYYGGSIIYSATIMSQDEIAQWDDNIQSRYLHEAVESDTYVVVFCSESR